MLAVSSNPKNRELGRKNQMFIMPRGDALALGFA